MSGGVNHWGEAERRAERFGQPVWRGGDEAPYVAVDGYEGCEGEKMPPHVRRDEDGEVVAECRTLGQAEQVAAMLTAALGDQPGYALCGGYPGAAVIPEPPSAETVGLMVAALNHYWTWFGDDCRCPSGSTDGCPIYDGVTEARRRTPAPAPEEPTDG